MNRKKGLRRITLVLSLACAIAGVAYGICHVHRAKVLRVKDSISSLVSLRENPEPDVILRDWSRCKSLSDQKALWELWTGEELPLRVELDEPNLPADPNKASPMGAHPIADENRVHIDFVPDKPTDMLTRRLQDRKQERQRDILSRRLAERKASTPKGTWKTLDGQPLPYTPTQVWSIFLQKKIRECEDDLKAAYFYYPVGAVPGGGIAFGAVWVAYLLLTWASWAGHRLLKWIALGFQGDRANSSDDREGSGAKAINRKQLIVLWVGIAIFVLVGLNPRWKTIRPIDYPTYTKFYWGPASMQKLVAAWGIIGVVTGGLIYTLRDNKDGKSKDNER